ncbi:pilus assembly FimT family protein [Parashewanella hymeniacidonis]|uniref:pilus assembly FimT family protein n=1 Tax=Parashewanella hymeniacidonis TaxID=2807618 RepID=UPI0023E7EA55|nr:type II secretion system protein [Parashewanella hymeniacidonis]
MMNNRNFFQNGFTLIELVAVIVLLGILAVVAAPKFIDFSSDARKATLAQTTGTIKSAIQMVHAKAVIEGLDSLESSTIQIQGNSVQISYGYPSASISQGLVLAVNIGKVSYYGKFSNNAESDWVTQGMGSRVANGVSRPAMDIGFGDLSKDGSGSDLGIQPMATGCYMRYFAAKGTTPATIEMTTSGC